jgi:hypothetical protein
MSDYRIQPGDRIKLTGDIERAGLRLSIGSMGTVVSVHETTAQVRFDAPPVDLPIYLDTDRYWIELDSCSGYFDVETARTLGYNI